MKVIIFDFDGTLHTGEPWSNWYSYMLDTLHYALPKYTEEQIMAFLKKYDLTLDSMTSLIADALIAEFGTAQGMVDFQSKNIYRLDYQKLEIINPKFLKNLSKKYNLYIVSNSPVASITRHFGHWEIDPKWFKDIFFNQFENKNPTKGVFYRKIMEREGVEPAEILVIGDNVRDDLVPAEKLGMRTFHTTKLQDIYDFFGFKSEGKHTYHPKDTVTNLEQNDEQSATINTIKSNLKDSHKK